MKHHEYWETRIQKIYDARSREIAVDELYKRVYNRLHEDVERLYRYGYTEQELTRTELYRSAKFLAFRRELSRDLTKISTRLDDQMSKALLQAYKDAGLAAKESIGHKSVWTVRNRKMAQACVERKWAGDNFSGRIWSNRDRLAREVEQGITNIIITGMGRSELLRELNNLDYRQRFIPKGETQSEIEAAFEAYLQKGRRQADTLVRTELMHTLNTAQIETYQSESVHYLEFEIEPTACPKCVDIASGNPYRINAIPTVIGHPNCRCTWIPVEDEDVKRR